MKIELKKENYFSYGITYYVEFTYEDAEEQTRMYEAFEKGFLPSYGPDSPRAKEGKELLWHI